MPTVRLRVEPVFCGPFSVGTVGLIKLVRERLGLSLGEAVARVNRCVFEGETVALTFPTAEAAAAFARDATALVSSAVIHAEVVAD